MDTEGAADVMFVIPQMPWVDPVKEANAWQTLIDLGVSSPQEVIRTRGRNPRDILDKREQWSTEVCNRGLPDVQSTAPRPPPIAVARADPLRANTESAPFV
jgi:capsid protein